MIKNIWTGVQTAFTAVGGALGYFLGGLDGMLIALLIFMCVDYVTGVMCGIIDHKLSSEIGFKGLFKKMLILVLVGIAHIIDTLVIGTGGAIRGMVICFYLSNEGVSLIENAAYLGLPVPEKLKEVLEQLHDREEKNNEQDG